MLVLVRNKLATLNVRAVLQDYTDESGEHVIGLTRTGKRFHLVRSDKYWELINLR